MILKVYTPKKKNEGSLHTSKSLNILGPCVAWFGRSMSSVWTSHKTGGKHHENIIISSPGQPMMNCPLLRGTWTLHSRFSARHLVGKMVMLKAHDCSSQASYAYIIYTSIHPRKLMAGTWEIPTEKVKETHLQGGALLTIHGVITSITNGRKYMGFYWDFTLFYRSYFTLSKYRMTGPTLNPFSPKFRPKLGIVLVVQHNLLRPLGQTLP